MSKEILFKDAINQANNADNKNTKLFLTKGQSRLFLINPKTYIGIHSRGTGKTTKMQALRSFLTAQNVPGGLSVFYNATYIGAQQRTVANTLEGWRDLGLVEGVDYFKNIQPPKAVYNKTKYKPLNWTNTVCTSNGHVFIIASNDRPGLVNSLSITGGIFVDECRFIKYPLMKQDLFPAIRGKNIWGEYNPFVFSRTFTSDMPMIEDDTQWLLDYESKMIPEQIYLIAQASIFVEKDKFKIYEKQKQYNQTTDYKAKNLLLNKISSLKKTLDVKTLYLNKIRSTYKGNSGSVYFDTGSFIANLNVLKREYFFDNVDKNDLLLAKISFLNIKPEEVENKFYSQLQAKHFITGNFDYSKIDNFGIADANNQIALLAHHILDYSPDKEIDLEFDFGDMCSCSISQTFGREERYLASFEVLLPLSIDDLIKIILDFLKHHNHKVVNVYKDPSGNHQLNKRKQVYGQQVITLLRNAKWIVRDKCPEGSNNPSHDLKHTLVNAILKEDNPKLPIVRIIRETNQQLESSMKKAPRIVIINKDSTKEILKDKSSEKKVPLKNKPFNTTDHSDHFDIKMWHKYRQYLPQSIIFA